MDFFGRQEQARRLSRRLVALYVIAVLLVIVALDVVVLTLVANFGSDGPGLVLPGPRWLAAHPEAVLAVTLLVGGVMLVAALLRHAQLREGGGYVAIALGGEQVLPGVADALRRRLLNIVEEMAIASGVPVPEVYVLEREAGINAFAAGLNTADAAIAVTHGALEQLSRDELQGVVAHEFSHILNGDMRLNTLLLGPLFGLMMLASVARLVLFHLPRVAGRGRAGVVSVLGTVVAGMVLMIGSIGLFFGRLLQAAVARNRERLADAAAVQFTRNPSGLRNALVKIGAALAGSRIVQPEAEDIAHLLFAPARRSAFATHPPLEERIRALDPNFDPAEFGAARAALDRQQRARREATVEPSPALAEGPARARLERLAIAVPADFSSRIGQPLRVHAEFAGLLRESLPAALLWAKRDGRSAQALLFALGLERSGQERAAQLAFIGRQLGATVREDVAALLAEVDRLHPAQRLPLLFELIPALRRLDRADRRRLLGVLHAMLQRQGAQLTLHAYVVRKLAHTYLLDELEPGGPRAGLALRAVTGDLMVTFSVLARAGHEEADAAAAYEAGLGWLLGAPPPPRAVPGNWPASLDRALTRLDRLSPSAKGSLIDALGRTVAYDGKLAIAEAELLRAICAVLHCPMPPLVIVTPA